MKIKINDDKKVVKEIKEALKKNQGYCPCRTEKTKDTKCVCLEFRESAAEGLCHCGLWRKIGE